VRSVALCSGRYRRGGRARGAVGSRSKASRDIRRGRCGRNARRSRSPSALESGVSMIATLRWRRRRRSRAAACVGQGTTVVPGYAGAPYEPGLLALREGAILEAAVRTLRELPDALLVDATGGDHPRRAGLALQLGAALELPTVGHAPPARRRGRLARRRARRPHAAPLRRRACRLLAADEGRHAPACRPRCLADRSRHGREHRPLRLPCTHARAAAEDAPTSPRGTSHGRCSEAMIGTKGGSRGRRDPFP
jgi:hypothetical protein